MKNLIPATNVICAFIGGLLSTIALHYAKRLGYDAPPDVASGLPAAVAVLIAHGVDMATG